MQPCYRGEHYIAKPESEIKSRLGVPLHKTGDIRVQKKMPIIPDYIPNKKPREGSIDWSPYHKKVFEMLAIGYTVTAIAREIGLTPSAVRNYISRYPDEYMPKRYKTHGL